MVEVLFCRNKRRRAWIASIKKKKSKKKNNYQEIMTSKTPNSFVLKPVITFADAARKFGIDESVKFIPFRSLRLEEKPLKKKDRIYFLSTHSYLLFHVSSFWLIKFLLLFIWLLPFFSSSTSYLNNLEINNFSYLYFFVFYIVYFNWSFFPFYFVILAYFQILMSHTKFKNFIYNVKNFRSLLFALIWEIFKKKV